MVVGRFDAEPVRKVNQPTRVTRGHEEAAQLRGIDGGRTERDTSLAEMREVKADVLSDERAPTDELKQPGRDFGDGRCAADGLVRNAGQFFDELWDLASGIDECLEGFEFRAVLIKTDSTNLRDAVGFGVQAGGFDIKGDKGAMSQLRTSVRISCESTLARPLAQPLAEHRLRGDEWCRVRKDGCARANRVYVESRRMNGA